jgi:hypothetical protein
MASSNDLGTSVDPRVGDILKKGVVIPAHPLAVNSARKIDERRQRALSRYYIAAGAGGLAVGVHTTQFQIHDPKVGLLRPVLAIAAEELDRGEAARGVPLVRVAGVCGDTLQAVAEASLARELKFQFGLLSLGAMRGQSIDRLVTHCRAVAEVIPLFAFYLQPKVGGIDLPYEFWRQLCEFRDSQHRCVKHKPRLQALEAESSVRSAFESLSLPHRYTADHWPAPAIPPPHFATKSEQPHSMYCPACISGSSNPDDTTGHNRLLFNPRATTSRGDPLVSEARKIAHWHPFDAPLCSTTNSYHPIGLLIADLRLRVANVVAQQSFLITQVQSAAGNHGMRPTRCASIRNQERTNQLIFSRIRFDERH